MFTQIRTFFLKFCPSKANHWIYLDKDINVGTAVIKNTIRTIPIQANPLDVCLKAYISTLFRPTQLRKM